MSTFYLLSLYPFPDRGEIKDYSFDLTTAFSGNDKECKKQFLSDMKLKVNAIDYNNVESDDKDGNSEDHNKNEDSDDDTADVNKSQTDILLAIKRGELKVTPYQAWYHKDNLPNQISVTKLTCCNGTGIYTAILLPKGVYMPINIKF